MQLITTLDDEGRIGLLCHLVVAQLVARARTGEWLRTDHLVESERIWLSANRASVNWFESVRLCRFSVDLATSIWTIEPLRDADELVALFTDGWRLDCRSPIVRGIHDICVARLETWRYEL
ncbi:hypothetical protein [Paraburkholderia hospita]|uniref:hypothetical protein n=1 Tax=Paraburkholderia hospita TaxID=169430 RepID=UPI000B3486AE|nr:hypothetical protein [Paraburkholderia hospita]OUL80708.1 hypothetical protein CA603_31385 [Paraburkholderia hospita]OUL94113.1 hypothetical protein CA601_09070 [Paraburkholderia hospita]